jgi:riboflavin transporter FmnP
MGVFTALAVVLNLTVRIPAPYAPFLTYEVWEIPIVAALLMYGAQVALGVALLNYAVVQLTPQVSPTGPLYNLAAVLSMLAAIYLVYRWTGRRKSRLWTATGAGIALRVGVMTAVNATFLPFPPPIGFSVPPNALVVALPLIALFNSTLTAYTVPAAHALTRVVAINTRLAVWAWTGIRGAARR